MTDIQNPWPDFSDAAKIRSPFSILNEYAAMLPQRTEKLVLAVVLKRDVDAGFSYSMLLQVPALANYRYRILDIEHQIELYPVTVTTQKMIADEVGFTRTAGKALGWQVCSDEESFREALGRIFGSPHVARVMGSLMAQAREVAPPSDDIPF